MLLPAKTYPSEFRDLIEGRLKEKISSYVFQGQIPRALLAFVTSGGFEFFFKTDENWIILVPKADQGLLAQALRTGRIEIWGDGVENPHFWRGDQSTAYEIAVAITFRDHPVAVLLIDYFYEERLERIPTFKVDRMRNEIADILLSFDRKWKETDDDIRRLTKLCVEETESVRGFTAVKRWDGSMQYFSVGEHPERFRYFSQFEGLCGQVIRTGKMINAPYVWDQPNYRSSDDQIKSEAIWPIVVGEEVVGVLNMEANKRNNYSEAFIDHMKKYAVELAKMVDGYRIPLGSKIGMHSVLLSDLIEQFSVASEILRESIEEGSVTEWALELCRKKILKVDGVVSAEFSEGDLKADPDGFPKAADDWLELRPGQRKGKEKSREWGLKFELLSQGIQIAELVVTVDVNVGPGSLQIIYQLCRITSNEIQRRNREARSDEFEKLVGYVSRRSNDFSVDELFIITPKSVKLLLDCDHVTLFRISELDDGTRGLRVWASTAVKPSFKNGSEPFYRISDSDGLTGYAAGRDQILIIRNVRDEVELQKIDPNLKWEGRMVEDRDVPIRSVFAIPLRVSGELVALIRGYRSVKRSNAVFSDSDRERLSLIRFLIENSLEAEARRGGCGPTN
jgi:putative methionine-R-sulfoxide reductase with GAF domain